MRVNSLFLTGAHTGLGLALATHFLDAGAQVYGVSRQEPASLAGRSGWKFASVDLTDEARVAPALEELLNDTPALDLAILNAGVLGPIQDLAETTLDELRAVQEINVWANKVVIDALAAHDRLPPLVIGISSGAAIKGSGGWGGYAVSKAALNMLFQVLADERPQHRFIALAPGIIDTAMTRSLAAMEENPRHPATGRVRAAILGGKAFTPAEAAAKIDRHLDDLRTTASGSYVDVRNL